jgi:hypothetical protein
LRLLCVCAQQGLDLLRLRHFKCVR